MSRQALQRKLFEKNQKKQTMINLNPLDGGGLNGLTLLHREPLGSITSSSGSHAVSSGNSASSSGSYVGGSSISHGGIMGVSSGNYGASGGLARNNKVLLQKHQVQSIMNQQQQQQQATFIQNQQVILIYIFSKILLK